MTAGAGSAQYWLQPKPHMGGTKCFFFHVPTVETQVGRNSLHLPLMQMSQGGIIGALIPRRNTWLLL